MRRFVSPFFAFGLLGLVLVLLAATQRPPPRLSGLRVIDGQGTDIGALVDVDLERPVVFNEEINAVFSVNARSGDLVPMGTMALLFSERDCRGSAFLDDSLTMNTLYFAAGRAFVPTGMMTDTSTLSFLSIASQADFSRHVCANFTAADTRAAAQLVVEVPLPFSVPLTPGFRIVHQPKPPSS